MGEHPEILDHYHRNINRYLNVSEYLAAVNASSSLKLRTSPTEYPNVFGVAYRYLRYLGLRSRIKATTTTQYGRLASVEIPAGELAQRVHRERRGAFLNWLQDPDKVLYDDNLNKVWKSFVEKRARLGDDQGTLRKLIFGEPEKNFEKARQELCMVAGLHLFNRWKGNAKDNLLALIEHLNEYESSIYLLTTQEIKDVKLKYNEKYSFENINFNFDHQKGETSIKNANFYYKKLKFLSDQIIIATDPNGKKLVTGEIRNKKTTINLNVFKSLFENDLNFIKDQEITFETKNKFSFKTQKGKIKGLKYTSQIDLENISLSPEDNLLKNYFNNYKNSILLKNNLIKLKYENKNLNIKGESDYSFDTSFDKIEYKINKKKDSYDFLTLINFDNNPIKIKPINYSKEKNKKSNLKLKGSYNKNKVKFNEIIYNEDQNFFEVRDLNLNNNFKIVGVI